MTTLNRMASLSRAALTTFAALCVCSLAAAPVVAEETSSSTTSTSTPTPVSSPDTQVIDGVKYSRNTSWETPKPTASKPAPKATAVVQDEPEKKFNKSVPLPKPELATDSPGSRKENRNTGIPTAPKALPVAEEGTPTGTASTATTTQPTPQSSTARTAVLTDQQKRELEEMARKSKMNKDQRDHEVDLLKRKSDTWRHVNRTITERGSSTR